MYRAVNMKMSVDFEHVCPLSDLVSEEVVDVLGAHGAGLREVVQADRRGAQRRNRHPRPCTLYHTSPETGTLLVQPRKL